MNRFRFAGRVEERALHDALMGEALSQETLDRIEAWRATWGRSA